MIRQLLQTGASGAIDGVAESGHAYARRFAEAGLTPHGRMMEQLSGLTQVDLITSLAAAEEDANAMNALIAKLKAIQAFIITSISHGNTRVALTCGSEAVSSNEASLRSFLTSSTLVNPPSTPLTNSPTSNLILPTRTFFPLPYQVSYTGLALPTQSYISPDSPSLSILAQLLTHNYLHAEIREKGGAYGAGAYARGLGGVFGMYSYRDPTPEASLATMKRAVGWAAEREWSGRELEEAKLSVFQGLDRPEGVDAEGMVRFLSGIGAQMEQERRERLLDVDAGMVKEAARELSGRVEEARLAVLGKFKGDKEGWEVRELGAVKGRDA